MYLHFLPCTQKCINSPSHTGVLPYNKTEMRLNNTIYLFTCILAARLIASYITRDKIIRHKETSPLFFFFFYAPNFEEVEGAYWFGSVRLSV